MPLPPALLLREYEQFIPGISKDLHDTYKDEVKHRRGLDSWTVKGGIVLSFVGVVFGLIIALTGFYVAWDLAQKGHDGVAALIAALDIVAIVAVFVYGTNARNKAPSRNQESGEGRAIKPPRS